MDELEISGKRYISTRRAAREHGYHSDYMGQLIRGGKVAGQKVGRSWYIDEQSLAAYLGKAPASETLAQPATEPAPAPVIQHEPESAPSAIKKEPQPEPAPVVVKEEPQPEATVEEIKVIEAAKEEIAPEPQKVEEIQKEVEEEPTKIPIHIPKEAIQEIGGLRYAHDDSPSLPIVTRMPRHPQAPTPHRALHHATPPRRTFPVISLSVVGVLALGAAIFVSNFVTINIVSEQGKAATVQYAIHW
jgi:outer membrane biosynthesis protein TonB